MVPTRTSLKIAALRFPLCLGPVLLHLRYLLPAGPFAILLCASFAHVAVPLFFIFSGYLFYSSFELSASCYTAKLRSRATTILVPYLLWNVVAIGFFILKSLVLTARGLPVDPISSLTAAELVTRMTGVSAAGNGLPANSPLWYLRDLMVHFALSPAYALLIRRIPKITLAVLASPFVLATLEIEVLPGRIFTWFALEGLFFFVLGFYLVGRERAAERLARAAGWYGVCLFLALCIVKAFLNPFGTPKVYEDPMNCLIIPSGVLAVWFAADRLIRHEGLTRKLKYCARFSFFIFASHMIVIKTGMVLLRAGPGARTGPRYVLVSVGAVAGIFGGGILLFLVLQKLSRRFLSVLIGRRTGARGGSDERRVTSDE